MIQSKKLPRTVLICCALILSNISLLYAEDQPVEENSYVSIDSSVSIILTSIASKKEEMIDDAPGVISVITQDELRRFGGTTLADILKRVPSFLGCTIYMTDRSVIASRGDQIGSSSSHILLLLNGRPMREVMEGGIKSEVYESFPLNIIDRIEIIRGPGSVLYGSQAFSAVINVITKRAENNTGSVSGMLGEGLKNNVTADLQYKIGDFGIVLAGRYADKGRWKTKWAAPADPPGIPLGIVHHIDVEIPDYGPGIYGEMSYKNLRLMGSYNQWSNHYFIAAYEWLNTAGIIMDHTTNKAEWKKIFGDLEYKHEFTEWYNTTMNVTYSRSLFKTQGSPATCRDAYEILGELTNFLVPFENFNVLVGGVGGFITGLEKNSQGDTLDHNRGIFNKGHKGINFSGYAQVDYRWDWCKIIGGLQINKVRFKDSLDHVDNFNADFNPRVGLIFYPLDHITIKTLYSTAYRAPSLNELYMDYSTIAGKMTRRNDPHFAEWDHNYSMQPEKMYTYDLGFNYHDNTLQLGINGFHSRIKNLISSVFDTTRYSIATWDNFREATIFGFELEGKYFLSKSLLFEGSVLFQHNYDDTTGEVNVTPLPNFSAKGGLSYRGDFGLTISAYNTFQQSVDPKYYDTLNKSTKYFNMTNLYCSYDLHNLFTFSTVKELALVLAVDNLFDEEVWLPSWGQGTINSIPCIEGRTIYGGFKAVF